MGTNVILQNLLARRAKLQQAYDDLISQPESYSISGSVSATNRKLAELRAELASIDEAIAAASGGDVLHRRFPNYSDNC